MRAVCGLCAGCVWTLCGLCAGCVWTGVVDRPCLVRTQDDVHAGIGVEKGGDSIRHPHSVRLQITIYDDKKQLGMSNKLHSLLSTDVDIIQNIDMR